MEAGPLRSDMEIAFLQLPRVCVGQRKDFTSFLPSIAPKMYFRKVCETFPGSEVFLPQRNRDSKVQKKKQQTLVPH